MSNFKCSECGMINIDCGKEGYKTPKELRYEKALEEIGGIAIKNQRENFYYDGLNELIEITIKLTSDYTLILDIINKAKDSE